MNIQTNFLICVFQEFIISMELEGAEEYDTGSSSFCSIQNKDPWTYIKTIVASFIQNALQLHDRLFLFVGYEAFRLPLHNTTAHPNNT